MSNRIREATPADATAILPIYNHAVRETTSVWTEAESDVDGRREWLEARRALGYPVLVAEHEGAIAGFASFGDFRPWPGYRHTVENSVYVAPALHRRGLGRELMEALIARAQHLGKHAMIAGIEASNTASLRLHASVGFVEVARMPQVGCKFGRWLDLVLMQRRLDGAAAPPE